MLVLPRPHVISTYLRWDTFTRFMQMPLVARETNFSRNFHFFATVANQRELKIEKSYSTVGSATER